MPRFVSWYSSWGEQRYAICKLYFIGETECTSGNWKYSNYPAILQAKVQLEINKIWTWINRTWNTTQGNIKHEYQCLHLFLLNIFVINYTKENLYHYLPQYAEVQWWVRGHAISQGQRFLCQWPCARNGRWCRQSDVPLGNQCASCHWGRSGLFDFSRLKQVLHQLS